jgi:ABC-type uncharacterized transport system involved in gliding motility auxiliary subunit
MASTQPPQDITITRASIGLVMGLIGLIGLIFAVVTFAWYLTVNGTVFISLAVGLIGLVSWAVIAPKEFVNTFTGRQARYSVSVTIAAILLLGVVTLVYIITARANVAVDITAGATYTLSPTTLEVIERIPEGRQIQILGFYSSRALALRERDDQFLRQYQVQSEGIIQVEYIDPIQNPAIAENFGIREEGELVLFMTTPDGSIDNQTVTYVSRDGKQERDVTGALNFMLNDRVFKVYFDESRTNLSIFDETQQGLTLVDNNLRRNGIQTDTLNLFAITEAGETIPNDASVLVMARPIAPYLAEEVAVLDEYMQRGGSLLVLADATFTDRFFMEEGSPLNTYLTENYGLRARNGVIVDPLSNVQTPLDIIGYATFAEPPVGSRLPTEPTFFRVARAIEVSPEKPETVANGRIIAQSEASFAETDIQRISETNTFEFDPETDIPGPIDVAGWAWDEQGNDSKVVLIGDGDFTTNGVIESGAGGNAALITQSIVWLSGVDAEITFGFAANPSQIPTIFVSGQTLDLIGIITIAVIPILVLMTGIVVWYRRTFA